MAIQGKPVTVKEALDDENLERAKLLAEKLDCGFEDMALRVLKAGIDQLSEEHEVSLDSRSLEAESLEDGLEQRLNDHEQILLKIIKSKGEVSARDLYPAYRERVTWERSRSTLRNYLDGFEKQGLITVSGPKNHQIYRTTG